MSAVRNLEGEGCDEKKVDSDTDRGRDDLYGSGPRACGGDVCDDL